MSDPKKRTDQIQSNENQAEWDDFPFSLEELQAAVWKAQVEGLELGCEELEGMGVIGVNRVFPFRF